MDPVDSCCGSHRRFFFIIKCHINSVGSIGTTTAFSTSSKLLGLNDGTDDGSNDGSELGTDVGTYDGEVDGANDGRTDGTVVGIELARQ